MKRYDLTAIRNIGLIAQGGAGKTTLTEAMLFTAGATTRLGRVEDGTTVTDFDEDEVRRKITISAALTFCEWRGHKINLVDTPGFPTFLTDTKICLRALEGAVVVVEAVSGVKVGTEKVWGYANEYELPRLIFVSKMDRERADFFRALEDVRKNLSRAAYPLVLPIGQEAGFAGVVDLIRRKAYRYGPEASGKVTEADPPAEVRDRMEEHRSALVEAVAEADDQLLEKYLEAGELTGQELQEGLARAVRGRKVVPVLCGSGARNIGVQPLLDAVVGLLPSPADRPSVQGTDPKGNPLERPTSDGSPLTAWVFKTVADPYAGKVTLFRVYAGSLGPDANVLNSTRGVRERVGQVILLRGKQQIPVEAIGPGDLGATLKLKETGTGDTLCDERAPMILPAFAWPNPVISYAIEPKAKGDEEKMSSGLQRLREEDPTLQIHRDPQTRETILAGMGRAHLEVAVERLKRKFGVDVLMKTPRVPYKETVHGRAEVQGKYKKQTGGRGQYGDCWIRLEPLARGGGYEFSNQIVGGVIPRQYIPAVEKGILEAMERGVLAGYPVVDVRATLYDGSYHVVDSSEMAFKIAGSLAFKKGFLQAGPGLLEPIMTVEVVAPDECMGDIIGDLNAKRGRVLGIEAKHKNQAVRALVPLAEMMEYDSRLRSLTGDRGDYSMEFSHYEEVPAPLQEKIIAEAKRGKAEEEEE